MSEIPRLAAVSAKLGVSAIKVRQRIYLRELVKRHKAWFHGRTLRQKELTIAGKNPQVCHDRALWASDGGSSPLHPGSFDTTRPMTGRGEATRARNAI